jgi:hypothetical protein
MDDPGAFPSPGHGGGRVVPGCPAVARPSEVDDWQQTTAGQPAGQRRFDTRWPSSRFCGHHIYGIWAAASWGHEVASSSSPGCVAHTAATVPACTRTLVGPADPLRTGLGSLAWRAGHRHRESCRPGTGSHPRARHRVLTWCPGGRGSGTTCRASTATRTHGCGGMGPGRSGRPGWSWGTVGHGLTASNGQSRQANALVDGRVRHRAAGPEADRVTLLRQRFAPRSGQVVTTFPTSSRPATGALSTTAEN